MMKNIIKGEPNGFPVYVVFNEYKVLGVFVDKDLAEDCMAKNLNSKHIPMLQATYIEGIKTISYELIKRAEIKPDPPEVVAFNSMTIKGVYNNEDSIRCLEHNIFDAYVIRKQLDTMLYIYKGNGEWYTFIYECTTNNSYAKYVGIKNI